MEIRGSDENEQIARLERDNRALREQLTTACSKLERIQITLRSLSESLLSHVSHGSESDVQEPLPNAASDKGIKDTTSTTGNSTMRPTQSQPEAARETIPSATYQCGDEVLTLQSDIDGQQLLPFIFPDSLPTGEDFGTEQNSPLGPKVQGRQTPVDLNASYLLGGPSDARGLPGIWTHEYQMGPASFLAKSPSADKIIQGLANTNSSFSDHMQMIRGCLKMQWRKATLIRTNIETTQVILQFISCCHGLTWLRDGLRLSATMMLSHFNSLNRPAALDWYTATRFQDNIVDLLLWQINRSRVNYSSMHANYRPSALQLLETYPSVIDWCPFPTIRDKLILLHSANPFLDQIICDIATAYVVEVDADKLVLGQVGRAYIRVWDLVCAFEAGDIENDPAQNAGLDPERLLVLELTDGQLPFSLPAPSVESLFQPPYARRAFKSLALDDGVPRFKVDPSLFIQYPELYDSGADILAKGAAIIPKLQTTIPRPTLPRHETLRVYRNVADWCVNAICRASLTEAYKNGG